MLQRIILVSSVLLFTFFQSCNTHKEVSSILKESGEIVVAMDVDMPGYFVLNGESYGYQYDLLKAYADYLGVNLRVVSESSPLTCRELLENGEVDIVATLASHVEQRQHDLTLPIYKTSYVILAKKGRLASRFNEKDFSLTSALGGSQLLVSSGFKSSVNYSTLLDSLKSTAMFVSSKSSFDLIESLSVGDYDYLICEKSEAQIGCALVKNVTQVYEFSEQIPMSIVVGREQKALLVDLQEWMATYRNSEEYAMLNDLYFEKGIVGQLIGQNAQRTIGGISAYDNIIREVSEKEGHDWRMMSAIAYSESRFNPFIVSARGAKGLMQIMPIVARQFNIAEKEIMKPEINIMIAAKLLNKIQRTLKMSSNTSYNDRMSIILACYNGGIGHVMDARRLASKYGANPDSWADVSRYLKLKADPEYINDDVVKCGKFSGSGQTLAFVNNVLGKYTSYCNVIQR